MKKFTDSGKSGRHFLFQFHAKISFDWYFKKKGPTTRLMVEPFSDSTLNQKKNHRYGLGISFSLHHTHFGIHSFDLEGQHLEAFFTW